MCVLHFCHRYDTYQDEVRLLAAGTVSHAARKAQALMRE